MATLTVTLDPAILEAAKLEAERRQISVDQFVAESIAAVAKPTPSDGEIEDLIRVMRRGPLGNIDRPLTRDEVYAERMWPRS